MEQEKSCVTVYFIVMNGASNSQEIVRRKSNGKQNDFFLGKTLDTLKKLPKKNLWQYLKSNFKLDLSTFDR